MENRDVNKLLLAVLIKWVRKAGGGEALENVEGRAAYIRIPGSWLHLAFCPISGDKPVAARDTIQGWRV